MTEREYQVPTNEAERQLLEQVRREQGLDSIEQAAEWLAKAALRKAARRSTGRGRALYPVVPGRSR